MRTYITVYGEQHTIQVVIKYDGSAVRLIDGTLTDTTNDLLAAGDEPAPVGVVGDYLVEAFVRPDSADVRVNGVSVGGGLKQAAVA